MKIVDGAKKAAKGAKNFISNVKQSIKKVVNAVKFFATPLGYVVGWILMAIFIVILFQVLVKVGSIAFEEIFGTYTYDTYEADLEVMQELASAGYGTFLNSEDLQGFKNFEYALIMDVAEFLKTGEEIIQVELKPKKASEADREKAANTPDEQKIEILSSESEVFTYDNDFYSEYGNKYNISKNMNIELYADNMFKALGTEKNALTAKNIPYGSQKVDEVFVAFEFKYKQLEDGTYSETSGELIPYLYFPRDEVEYQYCVGQVVSGEKNTLISMSKELNAYNPSLPQLDGEWGELVRETYEGRPITVKPEETFEVTPYYADESTATMYKVPVETIIGRYMPKLELLEAWCIAKKEASEKEELVYQISDYIKKLYVKNSANTEKCQIQEVDGKNYLVEPDDVRETFLSFGQIGLEVTKYSKLEAANDKLNKKITYFTGIEHAVAIDPSAVSAFALANNIPLGKVLSALSGLGFKQGQYIFAEAAQTEGYYYVPSGFAKEEALVKVGVKEEDIAGLTSQILSTLTAVTGPQEAPSSPGSQIRPNPDLSGPAQALPDDSEASVTSISATYRPIFTTAEAYVNNMVRIENKRMPALLVKSAETWARSIHYNYTIKQDIFDPDDEKYILPESPYFTGLMEFSITQDVNNYRTKAYEELFTNVQEKDVVAMFLQFEEYADNGETDCYEYMRDLYKLVKETQEYSISDAGQKLIHEDTYTYVYIPESILYYDDSQTQKIYWTELLGVAGDSDYLSNEDVEHMKTRSKELTWQILEYEKYDECDDKVYSLYPLGSPFVRAYSELAYNDAHENLLVAGEYNKGETPLRRSQAAILDEIDEEVDSLIEEASKSQGKQLNSTSLKDFIVQQKLPYADYLDYIEYMLSKEAAKNKKDEAIDWIRLKHTGADFYGREIVESILKNENDLGVFNTEIANRIYNYALENLNGDSNELTYELGQELTNMPVVAVAPGKVVYADYDSINGFFVILQHTEDQSLYTGYYHLKRWPEVTAGDYVGAGTVLGYEGDSGYSRGKHLHFEISVPGGADQYLHLDMQKELNANGKLVKAEDEYLYPVFNPFYNEDKAEENDYALNNKYMSLYRVVNVDDALSGNLTNNVPKNALLDNIANLIQKQGEYTDREYTAGDEDIGWFSGDEISMDDIECADLFIPEKYFNFEMADGAGYFEISYILRSKLYENTYILTTMSGGLPELTREQIEEVLDEWLAETYSEEEMEYIRSNVYNSSTISKILEMQSKYNISAAFFIAAAEHEQQSGLLCKKIPGCQVGGLDAYNLFNIEGNKNGGIVYGDKTYNVYGSYAEAIEDYARIMFEYTLNDKFSIKDISADYDDSWYKGITNNTWFILNAVNNTYSITSSFFGYSKEFMGVMKEIKGYLATPEEHNDVTFWYGYGVASTHYVDDYEKLRPGEVHLQDGTPNGFGYPAICNDLIKWVICDYSKRTGLKWYDHLWSGNVTINGKTYGAVSLVNHCVENYAPGDIDPFTGLMTVAYIRWRLS